MAKNKLKRNIILITGGSSKLGRVISRILSENGNVVYSGYNSSKPNRDVNFSWVKLDVSSSVSIKKAVSQIIKKEGKIDVLINCAGVSKSGQFEESTIAEYETLLEINAKGPYRTIKEVLPFMKKKKFGKIINITSMSGLIAFPNFGIYSASKFAIEALTTSLRYEVLKENIWVTNIEPGAIKNEPNKIVNMSHKTFRERYLIARLLLPLVNAQSIAETIEKIINSSLPPLNVMVGRDVVLTNLTKKLLPNFAWDYILRKMLI